MYRAQALTFDAAAAEAWLRQPAGADGRTRAESLGVEENLFGPGVDGFLAAVDDVLAARPDGLRRRADIAEVLLWLIADGEVLDQGALITVDLSNGVRLASQYQTVNAFTDRHQRGIAAAVSALAHIAGQVCLLLEAYQRANPSYGEEAGPPTPTAGSSTRSSEDPAAQPTGELVALVHSDLHVPHRRLRVTALHQLPTSDGVAFTAHLHLDGTPVGVIENDGHGAATTYVAVNSSLFNWRHMEAFVAQCRRRGEPVDEDVVLNCLVNEFDFTRELKRLTPAGLTLLRLMSPEGWCVTTRPVAALNTTRLADLAAHLTTDRAAAPGEWQIWTTDGWRHVVTVPDHRPAASGEAAP